MDPDLDEDKAMADKEPPRTYYVEVYENEYRGLGRRWREVRQGRSLSNVRWSYKVCVAVAMLMFYRPVCCVVAFYI